VADLAATFLQLLLLLSKLLGELAGLALPAAPLVGFVAWWLAATDWPKLWPALRRGGWLVGLLVVGLTALIWSAVDPRDAIVSADFRVRGFTWHLAASFGLAGLVLLCGWLQGALGWGPSAAKAIPE
jgi:hypothetical protein